jgi:hypothetical protein
VEDANLSAETPTGARARLGEHEAGTADFRQALAAIAGGGSKLGVPFYEGLLAELEAANWDEAAEKAC